MFSNGSLTEEQSSTTAGLLYVLNDIARVSKRCEDASPVIRAKLEGKYKFSKDAVEELGKVIDNVEIMYRTSIVSLENGDAKTARKVFDYRKELRNMEKKFNKNHLKRLRKIIVSRNLHIRFQMCYIIWNVSVTAAAASLKR